MSKVSTLSKLLVRPDFYYLVTHRASASVRTGDNMTHARAAVDWLLRANRVCRGSGFSKLYSVKNGWFGPYVETTGYIIPTLYEFARADEYRREEVRAAVRSSLRFLLSQQYPGGAFGDSWSFDPLVYQTRSPMVFDTGQVIFGLLAGVRAGDDARCLEAARRAGDWLLEAQDADGSWAKFTFSGKARTYYSRVAHALAELWKVTGEPKYRDGALRQLEWVLRQQTPAGSFRNCSFAEDDMTVLHVIAYTLDGLWRAGEVLGENDFREASRRAAAALARVQEERGVLAGHLDTEWRTADAARCLTGLAQMAEVWMLIWLEGGDRSFLRAADAAIGFLKEKQIMNRSRENLYGGLPGSHPWNGPYFSWAIPNWPQKFFIDALLLRERIGAGGS